MTGTKEIQMYKNVEDKFGKVIDNMYCTNDGDIRSIDYATNNYIIKSTDTGKIELMFFPAGFITPKHTEYNGLVDDISINYEVERITGRRRFSKDNSGRIFAVRDDASITDLQNLMKYGRKRTINNFFDYALNNKWEYFCTFTFADEKIRNSRDLLYTAWDNFRRGLRHASKDFKALAIYEPHKKGGLHLHALIGNVDLSLKPGRNFHTNEFIYSGVSGVQIFNCINWKNGNNTVSFLDPKYPNEQIVMYMSKYMTKSDFVDINNKRFFRTNNLDKRDTVVGFSKTGVKDMVEKFGLIEVKTNEKMTVYRNYAIPQMDNNLDFLNQFAGADIHIKL